MNNHKNFIRSVLLVSILGLGLGLACSGDSGTPNLSLDYEKHTLANGLDVIMHIDRSDPVVAVAMTYHVGSAREIAGRTGFAHLFEHLLFLESENLGKGGLDILINRVGGTMNGSTSRDRTNYYEVVPKDALEKMIWAEADKMGFFINTVSDAVLAKEKQVVKNEKRQSNDNRPYGHNNYVIGKNMYPEDHPYNWQVIGSLEDLQNAELQDVKDFFNKWYVPNNTTMVIAGDFDPAIALAMVKKYFGEFKANPDLKDPEKVEINLTESKKLYHEDNFARQPMLTLAWPTVENYHADSYALDIMTELLASGKKSPMYKVLVEDKKLTSNTSMFNRTSELAGNAQMSVRAFRDKDLDEVYAAIQEAFQKFETDGIDEKDLNRIKAGIETNFYRGLSSVLSKAFNLASYNIFAGDPGFASKEIEYTLAVTKEDIMRVYNKYIKNKNYIATSFIPKGSLDQMLEGSIKANVVEETIVQGAEQGVDPSLQAEYEKTPSEIDRTEPSFGESSVIPTPDIWESSTSNGIKLYGIENTETPLVQFNLNIKGGLLLDDPEKVGVANMLTDIMMEGTKNKTPQELEEIIEELGASIRMSTGRESITITGSTLAKNYTKVMDIVSEILLEPRWDEKEFEIIKQRTISNIRQRESNPNSIASNVYNKLIYGEAHIFSNNISGTPSSVESITMDDLKAYYENFLTPSNTTMHIAGAVQKIDVENSLTRIASSWVSKDVTIPEFPLPERTTKSQIYFVDVPDAKQSVIRLGYLGMAQTDQDFYPANILNYKLGGGGFSSELLSILREQKGYTYGISSRFSGSKIPGAFTISSSIRTNVTLEALLEIKDILETFENDFDEKYLADTKGFLIKSNARRFETLGAKLNVLSNISTYGLSYDYIKQREKVVNDMTLEGIKELASKYVTPDKMIYLVVGDAKTQINNLKKLGYGSAILIDKNGKEITGDTVRR